MSEDPYATQPHVAAPDPNATTPPPADAASIEQLLCGLLGVQWNLFDRIACERALTAWQRDRRGPLAEVLLQQGALDALRRKMLEALLQKYLEQYDRDPVRSLESLSSLGTWAERLRPQLEPGLQATLAHVGQSTRSLSGTVRPYGRSRFRILKPHARGGLGEVFLAHDEEVDRDVALKEIQSRYGDHEESRIRFLKEAEITGKLEHPGIVPIYGLGTYDDGRPYYAMRFIQGDSLDEAINRFHDPQRTWKNQGEWELEFRKLLQRFIDVCNAIQYAHSKGILHRDLKPGNVMLGQYGETLVVDWGLAKRVGDESLEQAGSFGPETTKHSSDSEITRYGQALGTPAFMSPEQAAGKLDELGPESDVYSLGATLYVLLTGKTSVSGKTLDELLARIQTGNIAPPNKVRANVPGALSSICMRALALKTEDRYPSARALSDDIERWLADDRVTAHRETASELVGRWMRTHRTTVAAATALAITAVVASVVGLFLVTAEQRETERQRSEAVAARVEETEQRRLAEQGRVAAEAAKRSEEIAKQDAIKDRDHARWTSYLANIQAADAEWERNNVASALAHLNACPESLRGWEHAYLTASFSRGYFELNREFKSRANVIAVSPNGVLLAVGDSEGVVTLYDLTTARIVRIIPLVDEAGGGFGSVQRLLFSATGEFVICLGARSLAIADVRTGATVRKIATISRATALACSADGTRLVTSGIDKQIRVWNSATGEMVSLFKGGGDIVVNPEGTIIANASGNLVRLRDASNGKELAKLEGHIADVSRVLFSPNGAYVVSCGDDRTIKIWNVETGAGVNTFRGHSGEIRAVAISQDGRRIVTGSFDGTVRLWDFQTGAELLRFRGHLLPVTNVALCCDDKRIVSSDMDGVIKVWDAVQGQSTSAFARHGGAGTDVMFTDDGRSVFSAGAHLLKIWRSDGATDTQIVPENEIIQISGASLSPSGKWIAAVGGDGRVRVWDRLSGERTQTVDGVDKFANCVSFSHDGTRFAAEDGEHNITIWDTLSGKTVGKLRGHRDSVSAIVFSPDGCRLTSGASDNTVKVWDISRCEEVRSFSNFGATPLSIAYSRDGGMLAIGLANHQVLTLDTGDGENKTVFAGHTHFVNRVAFSPDGLRLASGSSDKTIKIWDTTTAQETLTLRGHLRGVTGLEFSADGRKLVSVDTEGEIKIWDTVPSSLETTWKPNATTPLVAPGELPTVATARVTSPKPPTIMPKVETAPSGDSSGSPKKTATVITDNSPADKSAAIGSSSATTKPPASSQQPPRPNPADEPDPDFGEERRIAGILVSLGGQLTLQITESQRLQDVSEGMPLPSEQFTVYRIRFNDARKIGNEELSTLSGLKRLNTLHMVACRADEQGMKVFESLPSLQILWLAEMPGLTDEALRYFGRLSRLMSLYTDNSKISDAGLVHLKALPVLASITLSRSAVTGRGLSHFDNSSPLRSIQLTQSPFDDAGIKELARLRRLSTAMLSETRVTDSGFTAIREFQELRQIDLRGTDTSDATLYWLMRRSKLRDVKVSSKMTPAAIELFRKTLPECRIE